TATYTVAQNHQAVASNMPAEVTSVGILEQYVTQVHEMLGTDVQIDIIAHSLGGVITAYAMQDGMKNSVDRAITVDRPLRGLAGSAASSAYLSLFDAATGRKNDPGAAVY